MMAQGSFLLPLDTVQGVPGYYIPSLLEIHFFSKHFTPFRVLAQSNFPLKSFCFPENFFCSSMNMNIPSGSVVEELIEETENVSLDDFSIQVEADNEGARATVEATVVGRFFSKKLVANGTLRKALSSMWKLSRGWRLQSPAPKTFIFRLNNPREVKYVLENGPWNPCGGFMMAVALPEDGRWESADFSGLEIWVKALGVPMPYLTDECLKQMANRMGTLVRANKVRHNGTIVKDYLRFQVRINLLAPLLAGVSLPDLGNKKVWSYFKYERLPLFCFKCGIIGHEEDGCFGRKRMVAVHDGRSIPLYGPWLRDGARLENGFALLEVDELQDRRRLEKPESSALAKEASPKVLQSGEVGSDGINRGLESSPIVDAIGGSTRVEKEGMEGVVSQRSDNSFEVAYNDYVDCSRFPTQHVVHVANIFKEKLGTIKFGASREDVDSATTKPVNIKKLKKPCVVGPRGIPRPPIFGRTMDESGLVRGNKRKKVSGSSDPKNDFVDESQGQCCFLGVDKIGVKEAFGEVSGVNQSIESNSRDEEIDQSKKARLITQTLRSEESSFEADNDSEEITHVDSATTKPVNIKKLKKPCVVGPRGIPRPPIFGRTMDESGLVRGNKRKKVSGSSDPKNDFVDESQGQCCFLGVDKIGVKEAFGEVSGVNQSIESNSRDEEIDQSKKARLITQTLRSEESSFEADNDSEEITRGRVLMFCLGSWRISDWLWKKGKEGRQKLMELRGDFSLSINKV
ncbi:hypothetical protein G4B88_001688 [Cannabis sativa]|uniref:CCHC-type domain-containing protein n=1 Tax=Cannabis sativa TaxID=3483 RepID=A0A7J6I1R3_CANSA|nr:hypothetical protein G4B88_001688 [Cannabis sativa]